MKRKYKRFGWPLMMVVGIFIVIMGNGHDILPRWLTTTLVFLAFALIVIAATLLIINEKPD